MSSDEASASDTGIPRPALAATVPEGCRVVLLSPLDIHFSQTRIRAEFQDGRAILDSLVEIKAVPLSSLASSVEEANMDGISSIFSAGVPLAATAPSDGEKVESPSEVRETLFLCLPFPRIEVTRWRCKLREADGTPRVDPATGLDLYSEEERWFTFDNRRLCCLQRAAIASWPTKVVCEVTEVPQHLARQRELRKFDTKTFGSTVSIGRRDDANPEQWSWRAAAGLPPEEQPEDGVARQRSLRWRGGRAGGSRGDFNGYRGRRNGRQVDKEEPESGGTDVIRSVLLFFLIYVGLRIVIVALKHKSKGDDAMQTSSLNESVGAKLVRLALSWFRTASSNEVVDVNGTKTSH